MYLQLNVNYRRELQLAPTSIPPLVKNIKAYVAFK